MTNERLENEVQIVVHGGVVQGVFHWPEGLPGAVYDYDNGEEIEDIRCPIEELGEDGGLADHVVIKATTADRLINELELTIDGLRGHGDEGNVRYLRVLATVAEDLGYKSEAKDWNAEADKMAEALGITNTEGGQI